MILFSGRWKSLLHERSSKFDRNVSRRRPLLQNFVQRGRFKTSPGHCDPSRQRDHVLVGLGRKPGFDPSGEHGRVGGTSNRDGENCLAERFGDRLRARAIVLGGRELQIDRILRLQGGATVGLARASWVPIESDKDV